MSAGDSNPTRLVIARGDGERRDLEAVGMRIEGAGDPGWRDHAAGDRPRSVTARRQAEAERESLIRTLEAKNAG